MYFHVREDAINEARNIIDVGVLKPITRLGGITYGVVREGFELPRPDFNKEAEKWDVVKKIKEEAEKAKDEKKEVLRN